MRRSYTLVSVGSPLQTGVSGAHYLSLTAVGKSGTKKLGFAANEFICAKIGDFLGLPIPPFGMFNRRGSVPDIWFGSLDLRREGESLPPMIVVDDFVKKFHDESAGIIVFDVLIANSDRHEGNLVMADGAAGVDVFDHSHALLSSEGVSRLTRLREKFGIDGDAQGSGNRHCLINRLNNQYSLKKWISRVLEIPDFLIESACGVTLDLQLLTADEVNGCIDFLKFRKRNIRRLIYENRWEFAAINVWDMLDSIIEPWAELKKVAPDLWDGPNI